MRYVSHHQTVHFIAESPERSAGEDDNCHAYSIFASRITACNHGTRLKSRYPSVEFGEWTFLSQDLEV
jgi:hypothetical protein